jgi:hypothetical protein
MRKRDTACPVMLRLLNMGAGKKALLVVAGVGCFVGATVYRDYKWFFVAAGVACLLRALVFTRRF